MRGIKKIHHPEYSPMGDLITWRVLPTSEVEKIDPFIFLNHHGPQVYPPDNKGLPFGPHPHRGIETVTFIIEGDIMHKDNSGHESVIRGGGVQWMRAGKGLIHSEVSSDEFKKNGGPLEILQLWINIPRKQKMSEPFYKGLQRNEIPAVLLDDDRVTVQAISGEWFGKNGAFNALCNASVACVYMSAGGKMKLPVPADHNMLFYVVNGKLLIGGEHVGRLSCVEFNDDDEDAIEFTAEEDTVIIICHGKPLNEPVAFGGPFVMNTEEEIHQAYEDYRAGKFGEWK